MLFRLFVDEVGNGDLKAAATDPNMRYLSLTGVLTTIDHHARIIQPKLDDLKTRLFGHSSQSPVVLHRRELIRRDGPFATLRDHLRDNSCILDLFKTLPYRAITVQIDKQQHLETYGVWHFDPYHYCLRCLIERYVLYLNSHNWIGDVMIEARFPKADKRLKASFCRIYDVGTEHLPARAVQRCLRSRDIKMRPKTANIAGLQLADLIAHPSARHMRFDRECLDQPDDFGTKVADILIATRYRRHPDTMVIDGFGRKWLP
jgi:hypothetical protein